MILTKMPDARLLVAFVSLLLTTHAVLAATSDCSAPDFRVARWLDAPGRGGFPPPVYVVADLDGDGKSDLAVTDSQNSTVLVLRNDGVGNFGAPKNFAVGTAPRALAVGEFNGDGRADLVVASHETNSLSILLGTGGGLFGSATNIGVANGPIVLHLADVNGDSKLDVIVGHAVSNLGTISVLLGSGSGSFSSAQGSPFAIPGQNSYVDSISSGEFNSDGFRDLVVATGNGFYLITGTGGGQLNSPSQITAPIGSAVAVADFNGDAKADLALGVNGLAILFGSGTGSFSAPQVFSHVSGVGLKSIAVADLDGDGKLDVAAGLNFSSGVTYFKGDGTGVFTRTPDYLTTSAQEDISLGDLDSDGDQDIAAGNSVLVNSGGFFEAATAIYSNSHGAAPYDFSLGDFNNDGRTDMVVLHRPFTPGGFGPRISILIRDATGNFNQTSSIFYSLGSSLQRVVAGDFNGDGRDDIALTATISNPFTHVVSISLNNGDGTFAPPSNLNLGEQPGEMIIADINKDNKLDLLIGRIGGGLIKILIGNGSGGFGVNFLGNSDGSFQTLEAVDLNSDTNLDIVVTDYHGLRALIFLSTGTGGFFLPTIVPLPGSPLGITSGDFNGDTKPDLAISSQVHLPGFNNAIGNVTVLLGNGTGGVSTPVNYKVGTQPTRIAASDFDGDTKLDLAVGNEQSTITVFSGDGSGAFQSPIHFKANGGPNSLEVHDFNSDGRKDIAVALDGHLSLGIFYGKPPSTQPCLLADDVTVTEGDVATTAEVVVRLSQASVQTVRVNYVVRQASALEELDFLGGSGTVTFQPGETSKIVPVTIKGDAIDEDQEALTVDLSGAVNARVSDNKGKISIVDNDPPPVISINDVTVTEGNTAINPVPASFTVSLSGPSAKTVQVSFVTANGTAVVGEDFTTTQGTLTFGPGVTTQTVTVSVVGDTKHELDETFVVNLSNPVDASIGDSQGQATILNNDPIPAISWFDRLTPEGVGTDTSMIFTVTLANSSFQAVTVDYATVDGSATAGSDYVATSGTLTFNPGETQKSFAVAVKDDPIDEIHETFMVNLTNPTNSTITDSQAVGTIFDNDGPTVSINDVSLVEGTNGNTSAIFTLTLSAPSPQNVLVGVATANGTATSSIDYLGFGGLFVGISAGSTSATVTVRVVGDLTIENNETFFVNLSQPQDCTIADGQGVGTIINDDTTSVQFSTDAIFVNETAGSVEVTVLHVGDVSQPISAFYATVDGAAFSRSDYNYNLGTLQFAAGEASKTITIFVTDDAFVENAENFFVTLSGPGGARINNPSLVTVIINSDDVGSNPNPIDNSTFFVKQHYRDFLGRDPDPDGLAFWINQIESCGPDVQCREVKRINVSAAFYLSIEFQESGYLVYRTYKAAYGDSTSPSVPGTVPVVRLTEFAHDSQRVGQGVQVGIGNWQQQLEDNKNAYLLQFVQTSRFITAFPLTMTADEFVTKLDQQAGSVLTQAERDQLLTILGATPADAAKRSAVLRKVAEDTALNQLEFKRAFVLMQYFGYLRRNPNDVPDSNYDGWKFWLDKLELFNGSFVDAEMVKAFLLSAEYRGRFGN